LLGRIFTAADDQPGAAPTAVLDYRFWIGKLGADPAILGATLALNGKPFEVVGVLPPGLHFFEQSVDFYLPLHQIEGEVVDRSRHGSMRLLARLKPGVTLRAAVADLDLIMQRLAQSDPGPESQHRASAVFFTEYSTGDIRPTLLILLGAVGLVLIIACANVASLVLARSTARTREIAIRAAIGAGRARLVRQLLTENLLLAALGGAAGGLLALGRPHCRGAARYSPPHRSHLRLARAALRGSHHNSYRIVHRYRSSLRRRQSGLGVRLERQFPLGNRPWRPAIP
jgi:putative ABC transport system permease protein